MAATQAIAPLPALTLAPGMEIRFEAIDPATGLPVNGVRVELVAVVGPVGDLNVAAVPMRDLMAPASSSP